MQRDFRKILLLEKDPRNIIKIVEALPRIVYVVEPRHDLDDEIQEMIASGHFDLVVVNGNDFCEDLDLLAGMGVRLVVFYSNYRVKEPVEDSFSEDLVEIFI